MHGVFTQKIYTTMKVDLPSVIISIFALATFFVPIAWYHISQKTNVKKLTEMLNQFADEKKATLANQEVWGDCYALGIDEKSKKLLYLKINSNDEKKISIDLSEIDHCKVVNGTKNIRGAKRNMSVTNNIRLQLHYRKSGRASDFLEIYDGENGKSLTSEISIANKWSKSINSLLHKHSESKYKLPLL